MFFWKKAQTTSNLKGRKARLPERWYGPGVVIGHEWDAQAERDSYWVSYGGKCFLVAGSHMRHAEFEETLAHEQFILEMKKAFEEVGTTNFQYHDVRRDQTDPDLVIENVVGQSNGTQGQGLMSQMARESPEASLLFPRTSHARSSIPAQVREHLENLGEVVNSSPFAQQRSVPVRAEPGEEPIHLPTPPNEPTYSPTSPRSENEVLWTNKKDYYRCEFMDINSVHSLPYSQAI